MLLLPVLLPKVSSFAAAAARQVDFCRCLRELLTAGSIPALQPLQFACSDDALCMFEVLRKLWHLQQ